jgi:hypothetical protein
MSSVETLGLAVPKLPELDQLDVKAVRSFLPGKVLGRTAALLSLVLLVLGFAGAVDQGLTHLLGVDLRPTPWLHYGLLIGVPLLAGIAQLAVEWHAEQGRRALRRLALRVDSAQTGYFRIGPYLDTADDRTRFERADRAHEKVLGWIERSTEMPQYLTGDSGSGKSSLLNAYVLPSLREREWTVVEARAWQDPVATLSDALVRLAEPKRAPKPGEAPELRDLIKAAAKRANGRLLLVLDQFEEFVILGKPEQQTAFAALLASLRAEPVAGVRLLLALRSDYQSFLEELGLPPLRQGENLHQIARFTFSTAGAFMARSGLELRPEAVDRLLISAAELDETPGLVRPITLNVIGHVLCGSHAAPTLDAGRLVHHYIQQTLDQPCIRDFAPRVLEQLITEQSTKRPRSEQDLMAATSLRHGEVRAALNSLGNAALARPLDPAQGVWELSHDFIARAVARHLGRQRRHLLRRVAVYAAPALLAAMLLAVGGVVAWNVITPNELKSELANLGFLVTSEAEGIDVTGTPSLTEDSFARAVPLLARLSTFVALRKLDLRSAGVKSLAPLKGLTQLRQLDLSNTSVESLGPLEGLLQLQRINLRDTKVESLEPLKGLAQLQEIDLSNTKVESLEPLRGLARLLRIDLSNTKVETLEPLKDLSQLQQIDFSDTKIESLEPLQGLTQLEQIDLRNTNVASLEPLKDLTRLLRLYLSNTNVESLEPLRRLTLLQQLYPRNTKVESLEPLRGLTQLQQLYLSDTSVESLEPLQGLTQLRQLYLRNTKVASLTPLKDLTRLQQLDLRDTRVESLAPLKGLTQLQQLDLRNTKVESLEPLEGLARLQQLDLRNTRIASLEPLAGLTALRQLYLSDTGVESLAPLKGLIQLQQLYLRNTSVASLEPLRGLTRLQQFFLSDTRVESLAPLRGLTQLQQLDLRNTRVMDLEPLKGLSQLQQLSLIDTKVQEIAALAGLGQLQQLFLNGTNVASLEPLKGLAQLQQLNLSDTRVASLEPVQGLTGLQQLELRDTTVTSLDPLKGLAQLQQLDLRNTRVASLEPLKGLGQLQQLDLRSTRVVSLEPLKGLNALQQLYLSDTRVESLEPLKGLAALQQLYLNGAFPNDELDSFKLYREEKALRPVQLSTP